MSKIVDLTGSIFGKLRVICRNKSDKNGQSIFLCLCECGKEKLVLGNSLKSGLVKSCGCLNVKNIIGLKFGKLLVVREIEHKQYACICDCGTEKIVNKKSLLGGNTKSCGCLTFGRTTFVSIEGPKLSTAKTIYRQSYKDGDLSFDDFLILSQQNCYYCNTSPNNTYNVFLNKKRATKFAIENGYFTYNGLDRINSLLPHNINNVIPCCKWCNYAKRERTTEEFLEHITKIYNHLVKK
jgi:hypothetical protein